MKQLWGIITNKNTIWVQWVKRKYLKNETIWTVKYSKNFSWCWRNLLQRRELMGRNTYYALESGRNTLFWLDPWLDHKPLWARFDNPSAFIPEDLKRATVKDYMEGDQWLECPTPDSTVFRRIWDDLRGIAWRPNHSEDRILWTTTSGSTKDLTSKVAWESCRSRNHRITWSKAIWFSSNIPMHSFVAWRACLGALPTADQLQIRNISIPSNCRLCDTGSDTHTHIFFECTYSSFVWRICMSKCVPRIGRTDTCATEASRLSGIQSKGTSISSIPKLMFNAIIYNLWRERNLRSFEDKRRSKEPLCQIIIRVLKTKFRL